MQTPTYHSGELSQEQLDRILISDDFKVFVDRTTRLVERALCDSSDILFDYLTGANGEGGYDSLFLFSSLLFLSLSIYPLPLPLGNLWLA